MSEYNMHTHSHDVGRELAHIFAHKLSSICYYADDPDPNGDNASSILVLQNGVSAEIFESIGTGNVNIIAEVKAADGTLTYFAGRSDFNIERDRVVHDIAAIMRQGYPHR